jgi:SSS family solute:Na+ symporter
MVAMSFAGPKVNPKAFETEPGMFAVKPQTTVLIVITLLVIVALYVKFW